MVTRLLSALRRRTDIKTHRPKICVTLPYPARRCLSPLPFFGHFSHSYVIPQHNYASLPTVEFFPGLLRQIYKPIRMGVSGCFTYLQNHRDSLCKQIKISRKSKDPEPDIVVVDGMGVLLHYLSKCFDRIGNNLATKMAGGDLQTIYEKLETLVSVMLNHYNIRLVFVLDGYHASGNDDSEVTKKLDEQRYRLRDRRMNERLGEELKACEALEGATPGAATEALLRKVGRNIVPHGVLDEAVRALTCFEKKYRTEVIQLLDEVDKDIEKICCIYNPLFVLSNDSDMAFYPGVAQFVFVQSEEISELFKTLVIKKKEELDRLLPSEILLYSHSHESLKKFTGMTSHQLAYCAALSGNDVTKEFFPNIYFESVLENLMGNRNYYAELIPDEALPFVEVAVERYLSFHKTSDAANERMKIQTESIHFPRHLITLKHFGHVQCGLQLVFSKTNTKDNYQISFIPVYDCPYYMRLIRACAALLKRDSFIIERPSAFPIGNECHTLVRSLTIKCGLQKDPDQLSEMEKFEIIKEIFCLDPSVRPPPQTSWKEICTLSVLQILFLRWRSADDIRLASQAISLSESLFRGDDSSLYASYTYFANPNRLGVGIDLRLIAIGTDIRNVFSYTLQVFGMLNVWDPIDDAMSFHAASFFRATALRVCHQFRKEVEKQRPFAGVCTVSQRWATIILLSGIILILETMRASGDALGPSPGFDETFLTAGSELRGKRSPDVFSASTTESEEGTTRDIVPLRIPPPPLFSRRKYFSLEERDTVGRHYLSSWEKTAILSRLQGQQCVDEATFQSRLSNVYTRNTNPYIEAVQRRGEREWQLLLEARREELYAVEKRRNDIFYRYKNLPLLRNVDKYIARAELWITVVISHVFLRALIKERKICEAMDTFALLLQPMVHRYVEVRRRRREREALTQEMLSVIPYPTPQIIQSMRGLFFIGWPSALMELLASRSKPNFLKAGSYILHEGDAGRWMAMITYGTVRVMFKKKNQNKSRSQDNCTWIPDLNPPCYVGEFALVCREPRVASILCVTDVGYWTVSPEDYEFVKQFLSPEVLSRQRESTDNRRRDNLKRLFPLRPGFLRKFSYFEKFSVESLTKLADEVSPIVLHDGDYLIKAGTIDTSVYFIQDGVAVHIDEEGNETDVHTGTCLGMFDCVCGVNEKKTTSVVSVNYCDIWRMSRDLLMDVGLSEPHALLHCRRAVKEERALSMQKETKVPAFLRYDPYLSFCFLTSQLSRIYQLSSPCIFLHGERMVVMGQSLTSLIMIVKGSVDLTVAINGEQETFRLTTAGEQKDKKRKEHVPGRMGHTFVLGAYEYAASLNKYTCTASSYGLTEAFIVDLHEVNAVIPPELHTIIRDNLEGKKLVTSAYNQKDFHILTSNPTSSFSHMYRKMKESAMKKQNGYLLVLLNRKHSNVFLIEFQASIIDRDWRRILETQSIKKHNAPHSEDLSLSNTFQQFSGRVDRKKLYLFLLDVAYVCRPSSTRIIYPFSFSSIFISSVARYPIVNKYECPAMGMKRDLFVLHKRILPYSI
eukprot:gene11422-7926_t